MEMEMQSEIIVKKRSCQLNLLYLIECHSRALIATVCHASANCLMCLTHEKCVNQIKYDLSINSTAFNSI